MLYRDFGKTGLKTSLLGFGGFHLLEIPTSEAEYLLDTYLDAGGNYVETAASYGDGESELKVGRVMAAHRKQCILATKTGSRDSSGCMASLEQSLKNLKTDYIDLLIMHAVGTKEDLDKILSPNGALEAALKAKQQGKIGHIGISMHGQPDVLISALQQYPFDAVMTTINYYDRFNFPEIENELLPLASQKETAVILMKPIADGLLWRSAPAAFRYAISRPVSVVVTGINTREMLEEDLNYVRHFQPMSLEEEEALFKNAPELGNYVCRQCDKCMPCEAGIPIPEIFKYEGYYDRQMRDGTVRDAAEFALRDRLRFWFGNTDMAMAKYESLTIKADQCTQCGKCSSKCPYGIDIPRKLEIADYKLAGKKIY
ncbi:aldo/keto reductase [Cellulosilyticum sp. I15G10I2]|uniref:aldo/keto reductase n=1 Tax=Cellulosilyticum sp. I15G10I2 TaxID=1892843 RepID=UPI00085C3930|nr:aldo/keto reductase [Cellulosilyticum sp. I15G10I2]